MIRYNPMQSAFFSFTRRWLQNTPRTLESMKRIDYTLCRKILDRSTKETMEKTKVKLSAIQPYGYEILGLDIPWPIRHFPVIGVHDSISDQDQKLFGMILGSNLLYNYKRYYPQMYEVVKSVEVFNNGRYSMIGPNDLKEENIPHINILTIELFQLPPSMSHILDHYANYVACLFGAIIANNHSFPELRDFELSKTRRNRLFQEFVMVRKIFTELFGDEFKLDNKQSILMTSLFRELRTQNMTELLPELQTRIIPTSKVEYDIKDTLIFPQMQLMQAYLAQRKKLIKISSLPYYNGNISMIAHINEEDYARIIDFVKETYHNYPLLIQEKNESSSLSFKT